MKKNNLSKIQNLVVNTTACVGAVTIYATGVNLAKTYSEYHNLILGTTMVCSIISPHLLYSTTNYIFKKYNEKKQEKIKLKR